MGPGTVIGKRFVLGREAGSGGMGTVYHAVDRVTGDAIAIKVLHQKDALSVERFAREAAILADLEHPAIVRYIDHGVADSGEHWLAMEWLAGEDLASRLARTRLSLLECLLVGKRTADALGYAHARGMVHRDLKPSNLILPGGDVAALKLCDFGIARVAGDMRRLTYTGVLLGTLGYVAPEMLHDRAEPDARADVFSLGCVLYECLTGRPAFAGENPMSVLAKIVLQGSPLLSALRPDLPEALDDLVQSMLSSDPDERPPDAAAVAAALAAIVPIDEDRTPFPIRLSARSRPSIPPPSLGHLERRLVSLVLAGDERDTEPLAVGEEGEEAAPVSVPDLAGVVAAFGGQIDLHAGRSLVATFWSNGDAAERTDRAALCALALRAHAPTLPICVVTGRGVVAARRVGGELIDFGAVVLGGTPPGVVRLDEATAAALGPRFAVEQDGAALALTGAGPEIPLPPPVMGGHLPFVGRERELLTVERLCDDCAAEPMAGAMLVLGACGAGKSRLFRELDGRLARKDTPPAVYVGRADALTTDVPFGVIADLVRRAAGVRDGEPLQDRRRKIAELARRRIAAPAAWDAAVFLGELAGSPFPDDGHRALREARKDPVGMGDCIRAAFREWLAAECSAGHVLIVLEDLHWGDAATVGLVASALRDLRDLPLTVLVLARPEVLPRFPRLWAECDVQVIRLGPLSRRAGEALVRKALGEGANDAVVAQVLERAAGNPFYLQELVRAVAERREDALPASILDAIEARLDAEGSEAKRVLRAASIFGRRFSRDGIVALTSADPMETGACLARLEARELIAPASTGARGADGDYVFRHWLVREAAYATLTEDDRALGHALAAAWLEGSGQCDTLVLSEHLRASGQDDLSTPWYLRAAEQAIEASEPAAGRRDDDGEDLPRLRPSVPATRESGLHRTTQPWPSGAAFGHGRKPPS